MSYNGLIESGICKVDEDICLFTRNVQPRNERVVVSDLRHDLEIDEDGEFVIYEASEKRERDKYVPTDKQIENIDTSLPSMIMNYCGIEIEYSRNLKKIQKEIRTKIEEDKDSLPGCRGLAYDLTGDVLWGWMVFTDFQKIMKDLGYWLWFKIEADKDGVRWVCWVNKPKKEEFREWSQLENFINKLNNNSF